jgi:serine/threonine-protein kinase GIN4/serine/threonine-protein kinase KCC4
MFAIQIFHAVEYIHNLGYSHLDIKLENILLDEFFNLKLADMGSSVDVRDTQGMTDRRRGTPMYMPPEILHYKSGQEYDAYSADVY